MNLGVFGGSFDPVHNGHLKVAEEARKQFKLAEVIFVPAGHPWMKGRSISPPEHRVRMLEIAFEHKPHFKISAIEIERAGPSYTVDTIEKLRQEHPGDDIYFIMGQDSLDQLPEWHDALRLIKLCYLIVAPRPGYTPAGPERLEKVLPGITGRVRVMNEPLIDISATDIRDRVSRGLTITGLVPKRVEEYIRQSKLYSGLAS